LEIAGTEMAESTTLLANIFDGKMFEEGQNICGVHVLLFVSIFVGRMIDLQPDESPVMPRDGVANFI